MTKDERKLIEALMEVVSDGWNDGCGCCADRYLYEDTAEVEAVQAMLDKLDEGKV